MSREGPEAVLKVHLGALKGAIMWSIESPEVVPMFYVGVQQVMMF